MVQPIILAGGKGKRMESDLPKVLHLLSGKTFLQRVVEAVASAKNLCPSVIVVGHGAEDVKSHLGPQYRYVHQNQQLGTGHAVSICEPILRGKLDPVLVLYGDHPLITPESLDNIASHHQTNQAVLTMFTTTVPSFDGWHKTFYSFGRIVRDKDRIRIVEKKDASEDFLGMTEVNPGLYCFNAEWLWSSLKKIRNQNAAGEFYLTDLVEMAAESGGAVATLNLPPHEALGINTPEDLVFAEELMAKRL